MQHKLIYILLTLASVITYGQVNLSMDADKTEYAGKDIINLTIVLELNGSDLVQQTGFQLPDLSKFNIKFVILWTTRWSSWNNYFNK